MKAKTVVLPDGVPTPRIRHAPRVRANAWEDVVALASAYGLHLLPWQENVLVAAMGERADGLWAAKHIGLSVPRQNGKGSLLEARALAGLLLFDERMIIHCLATDTPVLTRDAGWKPISDLTDQDLVFHPSGRPIRVTGKSPVWLNQNCFRVTTTDGRQIVTDADHLWTVTDRRRSRSIGPRSNRRCFFETLTLTTKEMYESGVTRYLRDIAPGCRYALPRQDAIDLPHRNDLPVDPYVLGAWLGDGSSHVATLISHVSDIDHWRQEFARRGIATTQHAHVNHIGILSGFWRAINDMGLVGNKHIPTAYLLSSAEQREALLQGLMDTDGTSHGGRASFTNTNKDLADGVLFLARSLGWRAGVDVCDPEKRSPGGYHSVKKQYRVKWMPKIGDRYVPFRMSRKVVNLLPAGRMDGNIDGRFTVSISSIEPVESVPVSCITVDSDDGLFLAGNDLVATHNSAHEVRTAQIGFQRLKAYFENYDDLRRKVASIGNAVAREYIRLRNGQEVKFVTRSKSAIRGFSADCLLLDEGQILQDFQWEAILYTVSARPKHQIWLVGTPPLSIDEGVVFNRFRQRGLEAKDHAMAYLEWSAEDSADLDDPAMWAQANPALGSLITHDTVLTERAAASDEGFARERLGMWTGSVSRQAFNMQDWIVLRDPTLQAPDRAAIAVDVAPDRSWSCIGLAGDDGSGNTLVLVHSRPNVDWVVGKVAQLIDEHDIEEVALITHGQAALLQADFTTAGIEYSKLGAQEVSNSCGHFQAAVVNKTVRHLGQPELDTSVAHAKTRAVGEHVLWDRSSEPTIDISPLVAAAAAVWRWSLSDAPLPAIW